MLKSSMIKPFKQCGLKSRAQHEDLPALGLSTGDEIKELVE